MRAVHALLERVRTLGSRGPLSTLTPEASVVLNFSSIKQQQELSLRTSQAFVLSVSLPGLLLHKNQFILIFFFLACDSS